jgi:hypothetical protein
MSSGLRPVSASIRKVAANATAKRLVMLGQILENWESVVGANFAGKCQPVGIRVSGKGDDKSATLIIGADPVHATSLHYQHELIIARIERLLGHGFVKAIRITNAPPTATAQTQAARPARRSAPLTESQNQRLSEALTGVDDPELRERLDRLGQAIMLRPDKPHKNNED